MGGGEQFQGGKIHQSQPPAERTRCEGWWGTGFRGSRNMGHLLSQAVQAPPPTPQDMSVGKGGPAAAVGLRVPAWIAPGSTNLEHPVYC